MADIFHLSSPGEPTFYRYCPNSQSKLKPCKRRMKQRMDTLPQHACVAHFEAPTFCSSNITSLIPHYLSTFPLPIPPDNESSSSDSANQDQEPGPVILDSEECEARALQNGSLVPTSVQIGSLSIDEPQLSTPSRSPGSHRPRPESPDTWEEGNGRRLRFALSAGVEDDAVRQRLSQNMRIISSENEQTRSETENLQVAEETLEAQSMLDHRTSATAELGTTSIEHTPSLPLGLERSMVRLDTPSHQPRIIRGSNNSIMDDDALAIDDPRRSYDFADFMDRWRLLWLTKAEVPAFEPGLQPSVKIGRPSEAVTRSQIIYEDMDTQGLRWKLIGPDRKDALEARRLMHPSRRDPISLSRRHTKPILSSSAESEKHYRFRAFLSERRAHYTHYQLRNVLAASNRNDIFCSTGSKVIQTALSCPSVSKCVMDLSRNSNSAAGFRITCLSASMNSVLPGYRSDRTLFAGGFDGEYAMLDLNTERSTVPISGFVTHAYNGLVTFIHDYPDRQSGLLRAAFCSNDRKIRLMDVRSMRFTGTFDYDCAINCSAISPDGRLRVLVGDSRDAQITNAEDGNILVTLRNHNDHGFACAW